jgi:hypothetical protein
MTLTDGTIYDETTINGMLEKAIAEAMAHCSMEIQQSVATAMEHCRCDLHNVVEGMAHCGPQAVAAVDVAMERAESRLKKVVTLAIGYCGPEVETGVLKSMTHDESLQG